MNPHSGLIPQNNSNRTSARPKSKNGVMAMNARLRFPVASSPGNGTAVSLIEDNTPIGAKTSRYIRSSRGWPLRWKRPTLTTAETSKGKDDSAGFKPSQPQSRSVPDRVRHDASSVETVDGEVIRRGRTDRRAVRLPPSTPIETDSVVRLVIDGSERFTRPSQAFGMDGLELRGAYPTADAARDPDSATNYLHDWLVDTGLDIGRTVHVDVVAEGYRYGLRAPGEEAIYPAGRPHSSLQDIAEDL